MKKKYIFFDVDGTLTTGFQHGNIIPQTTIDTIKKLKENGHFLSLATGRPYFHANMMAEKAGIDNIVCNGGYSIYLKEKMILDQGMDQEEVERLLAECITFQIPYAISVEGEDLFVTNSHKLKQVADEFGFWATMVVDESLDQKQHPKVTRMLVDETYWERTTTEKYQHIILMRYYAPFMIVETDDKIGGIRKVMEYLDAPYEDVVVFGDGNNDIKMLHYAPLGIAMGNAAPAVKAAANYTTTDSDKDGIYEACKHFGWI